MRLLGSAGIVLLAHAVSADILAVDLGSQFSKFALVQTGRFDIVHNLQSKRKTFTALSFKNPVREFGDDAGLASTRTPLKVISNFRWLIGHNLTDPASSAPFPFHHVPGFTLSRNETTGILEIGNKEFGHRTLEEITAHVLWYAKNLVEEHEGGKPGSLKEVIVTVPSWVTKRERQAIINAGSIAGFTKISLVHETSAAAVQRGMDVELSQNGTSVGLCAFVGSRWK
jgi:molecular chaperone DnaK (HSP70)